MSNKTLRLQSVKEYADIHQQKIGVVIENIQKNRLSGKKVDGEWYVLISASEGYSQVQRILDPVGRRLRVDKKLNVGLRFLNGLIVSPLLAIVFAGFFARDVSSFEGEAGLAWMTYVIMFTPIIFIAMLIIGNKKVHIWLDIFAIFAVMIILSVR
ncbi:MAG: hypothetical protein ABFQ64_09405 [Campylobacterota bacterium]